MRSLLLCFFILFSTLAAIFSINVGVAMPRTAVGVWSDDDGSRSVSAPFILLGTTIKIDVNVTNIPKLIGGVATSFNGLDISIDYDPSVIRVSSSSRFVFDAGGEDTIVSVSPSRVPTASEQGQLLTDFDPANSGLGSFPVVRFIDLDGNGKYLIGEPLVFDANDNSSVDSSDTIVSTSPPRPPRSDELGKGLKFQSSLRFIDLDGDLTYAIGDTLVLDINDNFTVDKTLNLSCHFYEGCLFDNSKGTPLEGRIIVVVAKSCDAGCPTVSPGRARIAFVLTGTPLPISDSGLYGTLFRLGFTVQGTGSTKLVIASSDLTSPTTGLIPHERLHGYFSTNRGDRQIAVASVKASTEFAIQGSTVDITVSLRNFGAEPETVLASVRLNNTLLETRQVSIPAFTSTSSTFRWNTTSFPPGTYLVEAAAPLEGDVFPEDNTLAIEVVRISGGMFDFSLSVSPPSATVIQGGSITAVVTASLTSNSSLTSENDPAINPASHVPLPLVGVFPEAIGAGLERGDSFSITVNVTEVGEFNAYDISLRYTTTILTATGVSVLPVLGQTFIELIPTVVDDSTGTVRVVAGIPRGGRVRVDTTSEPLFRVNFVVDDFGTSRLDLFNDRIVLGADDIPHETRDGVFSNTGDRPVVAFRASGFPSGVAATFSPSSCSLTCSSIMRILTESSATTGTFPIIITAAGGGITRSTTFTLIVSPFLEPGKPTVGVWSSAYQSSGIIDTSLTPSKTFVVDINVTSVSNLVGFDLILLYDPDFIAATAIDIKTGTIFGDRALDPGSSLVVPGEARILGALLGRPAFSGSGIMAHVSFRVVQSGTSPLGLSNVKLVAFDTVSGTAKELPPPAAVDGYFKNAGPERQGPVADFTFSPTLLVRGDRATFDARASFDPDNPEATNKGVTLYRWNWGDGKAEDTRSPIIQHVFMLGIEPTFGQFWVRLTVLDADGFEGLRVRVVEVKQLATDFSLSVSPSNATVVQGGSTSALVTATLISNTTQLVTFTAIGVPTGVGVTFSLPSCSPTCSSTMSIQADSFAQIGTFSVTIRATGGGVTRSTELVLTVRLRPMHDVAVSFLGVEPSVAVSSQFVGIGVILRNHGLSAETVDLVVYYDSNTAATLTGIILEPRPFGQHFFLTWDTFGVPPGDYLMSATVFLATDENPVDNTYVDGTITIQPPPTLRVSPGSGSVGTRILVEGTGFPLPTFGPTFSQVFVTFDDMFMGFVIAKGGNFSFVFSLPHAEPGPHAIKAFDSFTGVRATVTFEVLPAPTVRPVRDLSVTVDVGAVYFPGDTADIFILTTLDGTPVSPDELHVALVKPDGSTVTLNPKAIEPGLLKASFQIPKTGSVGTYAIVVKAHGVDLLEGSALRSFEVKPSWISAQGPRIASATAIIGGAALLAIVVRRGYVRRKDAETTSSSLE